MTREEACRRVCGRCRSGEPALRFGVAEYFYHGNPFIKCDASALSGGPIMVKKAAPLPPADTDPNAKCGACGHSPAYHDGQYKRSCRAWNPDNDDTMCACKGWQEPKPPLPPATPQEPA